MDHELKFTVSGNSLTVSRYKGQPSFESGVELCWLAEHHVGTAQHSSCGVAGLLHCMDDSGIVELNMLFNNFFLCQAGCFRLVFLFL